MRTYGRYLIITFAVCFVGLVGSVNVALPITFHLKDVIFDDGGTASGWFQWNTRTAEPTKWYIVTTSVGPWPSMHGNAYDSSELPSSPYSTPVGVAFDGWWDNDQFLTLLWWPPIRSGESSYSYPRLLAGFEEDWNNLEAPRHRRIIGGYIASPEPATIILLLTGLIGLAGFRIKHRKT